MKYIISHLKNNEIEIKYSVLDKNGKHIHFASKINPTSNNAIVMANSRYFLEACLNGTHEREEFNDVFVKKTGYSDYRKNKIKKLREYMDSEPISPALVHADISRSKNDFIKSLFCGENDVKFGLTFTNGISRSMILIQETEYFPVLCECTEARALNKLLTPLNSGVILYLKDVWDSRNN